MTPSPRAAAATSTCATRGIPDEAIKVEVDGTNSYEELSASALILEQAGVGNDVVIVTDPYHALRAGEIAEEVGLRPARLADRRRRAACARWRARPSPSPSGASSGTAAWPPWPELEVVRPGGWCATPASRYDLFALRG